MGRFATFIIIVLIAGILMGGFVVKEVFLDNKVKAADQLVYVNRTVTYGDTLWEIAEEYAPEKTDLRKFVATICDTNNLRSKEIHPGQSLQIPVYS
jgi:LysM repeat protein